MPIQAVEVIKPPASQPEKREKPYPNTTLDVLRRLKGLAQENDIVGIQTENALVVSKLLEISEEFIRILKRQADEEGKNWEGEISYSNFGREHDGMFYWAGEGVIVGKNTLLIFSHSNQEAVKPKVLEQQRIEARISPDFKRLFSVSFSEVKTFDEKPQVIESIKVSFRNNRLFGLSIVEATQIPSGIGSFYEKPQGPIRELRIKFPT